MTAPTTAIPAVLSCEQLAKLLGVSPTTVRAAGRADGLVVKGETVRPFIVSGRMIWDTEDLRRAQVSDAAIDRAIAAAKAA